MSWNSVDAYLNYKAVYISWTKSMWEGVICWKDNLEYFKDNQRTIIGSKIKSADWDKDKENTLPEFMMAVQIYLMVAGLIEGFLQGPTKWSAGNRRRFSEFFCFLRIRLSCFSRKCCDGGCMIKIRMARFGLTKVWRILTMKPQSLEEAFTGCARYNSKESKEVDFLFSPLLWECTSLEVELRKPVSGQKISGDSLCHFYSKY